MSHTHQKGHGIGAIMLLSASLIWGVAFVAQSAGMQYVGPYTFTATRSVLAALGLGILILILDKTGMKSKNTDKKVLWRAGIILGVVMTIASNLQQVGLLTTSAGKAGFITSLYIVLVPMFGLFLKRRPHPMTWISVLIALVGLYFLSIRGDFTMSQGDLLVLASALAFTVQILLVDHYSPKVDIIRLNCIQFSVMAILSAIPMMILEQPKMPAISDAWLTIVYAGLFSGCGAYTLQMMGQRRVEPATASLLLSPENVFSALAGWVILGQTLSLRELFGCALVFAAIISSQLPWRKWFGSRAISSEAIPVLAAEIEAVQAEAIQSEI
ncbi:MAG: EamA family transporter [Firmicutes bacterium HGW-Firmicutes-9]|jgi:drug/metabolite transporter (DMT)-like permease|nr:MAG: EamA family transporter [Firmicutes bacterium HGW-Firmicutes-9]